MAGVFKSLDQSDVRITPFRTYKLWDQSVGYTTYTAPASSANQTQVLFSKIFGASQLVSSSAIYALVDANQLTGSSVGAGKVSNPSYANQPQIYKFDIGNDYNYITNTKAAYSSGPTGIYSPYHVAPSTVTSIPSIAFYDSASKKVYGVKGDLTNAFALNGIPIPSQSTYPDQTVNVMDIGARTGGNGNVLFGCKYGLWLFPIITSSFALSNGGSTVPQPQWVAPFSGSYIGVLASRDWSNDLRTHALQIDLTDPSIPYLQPGQLRYICYNSYASTGPSYINSSIIETDTSRYDISNYPQQAPRKMELFNDCVYALMEDDRLYIIQTGSSIVSPTSTYIDGIADVICNRSINRTTDFYGQPLPTRRVHLITRDGFVFLDCNAQKVGSTITINRSNMVDCRQYTGVDKQVKDVTNLRDTTNENIHIVVSNSSSFGETISFVVNPNTKEISNVMHFGSLKAHGIVTYGDNCDVVHASNRSLGLYYTSSLQGANPTKWYKFNMQ